jgi:hypothetical protein
MPNRDTTRTGVKTVLMEHPAIQRTADFGRHRPRSGNRPRPKALSRSQAMTTTMSNSSLTPATIALRSILNSEDVAYLGERKGSSVSDDSEVEAHSLPDANPAFRLSPSSEDFPAILPSSLFNNMPYMDTASELTKFHPSMGSIYADSPSHLRRCCAIPNGLSELMTEQQYNPFIDQVLSHDD